MSLVKLVRNQRLLKLHVSLVKNKNFSSSNLVGLVNYFFSFYKSYRLISPYKLYNLFRDIFVFFSMFKTIDFGFYFICTERFLRELLFKFIYFSFLYSFFLV